ncbi:MAG: MFS transporter, partial [Jannaschia sp.]
MERTRWDLVALIFAAGLLAAAQFGKISLTLPLVAEAFGRSVAGVSVLVSLVGIMGLTLGVMAGGIAAAFGPGRTLLAGLLLAGAASLVQATLPPFAWFALSRGIEGLAHLALVVAGPPLMAAAATDRTRPLVMGLWAVFFGASLAISSVTFPLVLTAGGLPLLFALHGVAMWVLAGALWRRVPRVPRTDISLAFVRTHRDIYGRLRSVAPGLGFCCYTFLFIAAVAVLPPALGRPGLALTLPLVTLATTLAGGALCRWFAPHHVAGFGYVGTAVGLAAEAMGVPLGVEVSFGFMGLIPGASFAAIPALNATPGNRARATGAIAQLGNLGTVTGTPVLAFVWSHAGTVG